MRDGKWKRRAERVEKPEEKSGGWQQLLLLLSFYFDSIFFLLFFFPSFLLLVAPLFSRSRLLVFISAGRHLLASHSVQFWWKKGTARTILLLANIPPSYIHFIVGRVLESSSSSCSATFGSDVKRVSPSLFFFSPVLEGRGKEEDRNYSISFPSFFFSFFFLLYLDVYERWLKRWK